MGTKIRLRNCVLPSLVGGLFVSLTLLLLFFALVPVFYDSGYLGIILLLAVMLGFFTLLLGGFLAACLCPPDIGSGTLCGFGSGIAATILLSTIFTIFIGFTSLYGVFNLLESADFFTVREISPESFLGGLAITGTIMFLFVLVVFSLAAAFGGMLGGWMRDEKSPTLERLSKTITAFRKNWKTFLAGVVILVAVGFLFILVLALLSLTYPEKQESELYNILVEIILSPMVSAITASVLVLMSMKALTRKSGIGDIAAGFRYFRGLFGVELLYAILLNLPALLLLFVAYLSGYQTATLNYFFLLPVIVYNAILAVAFVFRDWAVVDGKDVIPALRQSFSLVRKNLAEVVALELILTEISMLILLIPIALIVLLAFIIYSFFGAIAAVLVSILVFILTILGAVVFLSSYNFLNISALYLELRGSKPLRRVSSTARKKPARKPRRVRVY